MTSDPKEPPPPPSPPSDWNGIKGGNPKFDGLMSLARFRLDRWINRREHEWKISVTIWTLLGAVLVGLVSGKVTPSNFSICVSVIAGLAVIILHSVWVGVNWNRNMKEIKDSF